MRNRTLAASVIATIRGNVERLTDDELCAIEAECRVAFYERHPPVDPGHEIESGEPTLDDEGLRAA